VRFPEREESRDTGGEYVLVETILRPGATVAAAYVHLGAPIGKAFGYAETHEAAGDLDTAVA
jgi:hypothetical protein